MFEMIEENTGDPKTGLNSRQQPEPIRSRHQQAPDPANPRDGYAVTSLFRHSGSRPSRSRGTRAKAKAVVAAETTINGSR